MNLSYILKSELNIEIIKNEENNLKIKRFFKLLQLGLDKKEIFYLILQHLNDFRPVLGYERYIKPKVNSIFQRVL